MEVEIKYPMKGFKPLVVESYRNKEYNGTIYKRRLRINRFNAFMIDEVIGTNLGANAASFRFLVLDLVDIEKACKVLGIPFKPVNTYFDVDFKMCSFSEVPTLRN